MSSPEIMQRRLERERRARKAAEHLLEEKSREIYEINQELSQVALFAELSPSPIIRLDKEGNLILANKSARDWLQAELHEGSHISTFLPQFVDVNLEQIIAEDEIRQVAARIAQRYFQFVFKGVSAHGFVNIYVNDVTRQEKAKREVERAHRESEQLLSAISSVLIGVNHEQKIVRWNDIAEQAFGLSVRDVMGKKLGESNIPWQLEKIENYISSDDDVHHVVVPEVVFTNAEGKDGFLSVVINEVTNTEGDFNGYLILASDITEKKVLESQLVQAQKLESLGQLAAGIAHEINTPIQFIGDNTRFLGVAFERLIKVIENGQKLLKEVQEGSGMLGIIIAEMDEAVKKAKIKYMSQEIPFAIEETLGGVDQVATIVRAMKQFSHPGTQKKTLANINEAISSTINVARNEWKYVADLETNLAEDMPEVPCHPSEMNQVFLNMIVNAAHAIEEKLKGTHEKGLITIATRATDEFAEISISDNGSGIPLEIISRIFDPFFTTKEVGKGSGQGLSVAYNVVYEKHQGTIDVDSRPGEGTTFTIHLPIALEAEEVA